MFTVVLQRTCQSLFLTQVNLSWYMGPQQHSSGVPRAITLFINYVYHVIQTKSGCHLQFVRLKAICCLKHFHG